MGTGKKKPEYSLEDIWIEQGIQIIQEDYARLNGVSIWMLDAQEKKVWGHSAVSEIPAKEQIPELASQLDKDVDYTAVDYSGSILLLKKRQIRLEERVMGYVVLSKVISVRDIVKEREFVDRSRFYINIFKRLIVGGLEKRRLERLLNEAHIEEKTIEQEKERLQHANDFDEVTKVHSRSYFYRCLEEVEDKESVLPVSVIVGDVNNLKFTNDMFGHRHGDWLLFRVAQVLKEEAEGVERETGNRITVARCGGDEFGVLMLNTKRSIANYYCHRVNDRLKGETSCCLTPSISLGSAKKSEMSQSLYRLLETADAKMYSAKSEFKQYMDPFEEIMTTLFTRHFVTREEISRKEELVREFTDYLHWDSETVTNCVNLMRYQDIGLAVVPEWVYRKNERYTDVEWREIKKHPQLGMKLALTRPDMEPISNMMYLTHENYDGSGWPRGVSGAAIVPEVTAVRLVTEYLDKEYKHGAVMAYDYIRANTGRIFEPELAEKFIRFMDKRQTI